MCITGGGCDPPTRHHRYPSRTGLPVEFGPRASDRSGSAKLSVRGVRQCFSEKGFTIVVHCENGFLGFWVLPVGRPGPYVTVFLTETSFRGSGPRGGEGKTGSPGNASTVSWWPVPPLTLQPLLIEQSLKTGVLFFLSSSDPGEVLTTGPEGTQSFVH